MMIRDNDTEVDTEKTSSLPSPRMLLFPALASRPQSAFQSAYALWSLCRSSAGALRSPDMILWIDLPPRE